MASTNKDRPEYIDWFAEQWDEVTKKLKRYDLSNIKIVPKIEKTYAIRKE